MESKATLPALNQHPKKDLWHSEKLEEHICWRKNQAEPAEMLTHDDLGVYQPRFSPVFTAENSLNPSLLLSHSQTELLDCSLLFWVEKEKSFKSGNKL